MASISGYVRRIDLEPKGFDCFSCHAFINLDGNKQDDVYTSNPRIEAVLITALAGAGSGQPTATKDIRVEIQYEETQAGNIVTRIAMERK